MSPNLPAISTWQAIAPGRGLRSILVSGLAALTLLASYLIFAPNAVAAPTTLVGTFKLKSGSCSGGRISGTYLRMILPSGGTGGPYMSNSDSPCSDQSFTPLAPGSDGGLFAGHYQPAPSPAFDSAGNAKSGRVTRPARYYGTGFATATNPVDPQTKTSVPAPKVTVNGSSLSADLRSFSVSWNNQYFNQGAPKPNGSFPGNTRAATGTYNASTRAFTLNWTSQVIGGPFDKFTGKWHLEGTFVPTAGTSAGGAAAVPGTGAAGTSAGGAGGAAATSPTAGADPSAGALAADGTTPTDQAIAAGAVPAGHTRTIVTKNGWEASPWLLGLTIGIAVIGFGALIALTLIGRRKIPAA